MEANTIGANFLSISAWNAMILCIETSTSLCSVALAKESKLIFLSGSTKANDHASKLLSHIDLCLEKGGISLAEVEAIAISAGPGSFTGLRVGISAAKGISFALGTPLIGISTLEALSSTARELGPVSAYICAMIEARKNEVYTMVSDWAGNHILSARVVSLYDGWHQNTLQGSNDVLFCGNGIQRYQEICQANQLKTVDIRTTASNLIKLAREKHIKKDYSEPKSFSPSYLKRPHITQARKVL